VSIFMESSIPVSSSEGIRKRERSEHNFKDFRTKALETNCHAARVSGTLVSNDGKRIVCRYANLKNQKEDRMIRVKHFTVGTSEAALEYLDEDINKWLDKNKVQDVKHVVQTYGQSPRGMSGHHEDSLFIQVWYQVPDHVES